MLSLPVTLILLMITFGSLVAAGVPLLDRAQRRDRGARPGRTSRARSCPVDSNLPAVILLIGLAVGVDYSLFYLKREREERAAGRSETAALEAAAATSGRAVLISGVTVIVAMAGMFISGDKTFISFADGHDPRRRDGGVRLAHGAARDAQLARRPGREGPRPVARPRRGAAWASPASGRRSPARVMRRPGISLVLAGGAAGRARDPGARHEERHERRRPAAGGPADHRHLQQGEGGLPEGGRDGHRRHEGRRRAGRRARPPGIAALRRPRSTATRSASSRGTEVIDSKDGTVAQINIPTLGSGNDAGVLRRAQRAARRHRAGDRRARSTGRASTSPATRRRSEDFRTNLDSRLPLIFAFVFGLAFLLMLVTFRSIVIPIKAILLNLLSVGAAYGVLVLVFQNGHGESRCSASPRTAGSRTGCRCSCSWSCSGSRWTTTCSSSPASGSSTTAA